MLSIRTTAVASVFVRAVSTAAAACILLLCHTVASAQSCHTASPPANPLPITQSVAERIAGDFSLNEPKSRRMKLEGGKRYWFSAGTCPRTEAALLVVRDAAGQVLKQTEGKAPSFCFAPEASGEYTIEVSAVALRASYSWGSIDARFAESGCER